jgi:hypothetical protein
MDTGLHRLALAVALACMQARAAAGQTCYPPQAFSLSTACYSSAGIPTCFDSGSQTGSPAVSSVTHTFASMGVDWSASAALSMDVGGFNGSMSVGGFNDIYPYGAVAGQAKVDGDFFDCLHAVSPSGAAYLHIPIHLTGSRTLAWSATPGYVPPNPPATTVVSIRCAATTVGSGVPTPCDDPTLSFEDSGTIDTTVELVFGFDSGPVSLQFGPSVSASVGYTGTGTTGRIQGSADVELQGVLLPAYVTDPQGTPIPNATVTADSGFDYLSPAPEPGAAAAGISAVALLLMRRRRAR